MMDPWGGEQRFKCNRWSLWVFVYLFRIYLLISSLLWILFRGFVELVFFFFVSKLRHHVFGDYGRRVERIDIGNLVVG